MTGPWLLSCGLGGGGCWVAGQEKVARSRFCVSACGEAVLVFLQLLTKEIACGGWAETVARTRFCVSGRGQEVRSQTQDPLPAHASSSPGPGHPFLSLHKLFLWPKVAGTPKRPPHSQKHKNAFLQLFPACHHLKILALRCQ